MSTQLSWNEDILLVVELSILARKFISPDGQMQGKTTAGEVPEADSGDDSRAEGQTLDGKGSASLSFAMILVIYRREDCEYLTFSLTRGLSSG